MDRPEEMLKKFFVLKKKYSGDSHTKKISQIKPLDNSIIILSSPESICWLLNIRGYDLPNTPVVFCRMIITKNKNIIYVNKKKNPSYIFY
ncbi:MAG: aminopeptidase P family N-terminal domain-containing protein [Alphaproteobacteria bacterium]